MNRGKILRELIGLFVDDGALALALVVTIAIAAVAAFVFPRGGAAAGVVLVLGSLGTLVLNVLRAARR
jgi:lipopolysaccharide export LptBFGC system permease protein LptF